MGNFVRLEVKVWAASPSQVKIAGTKGEFISWVTPKDESARRHKHLYGHLKRLLVKAGKWPAE